MPKTLYIDPLTRDLKMDELRRHKLVSGLDADRQAIRLLMGTGQGEWFLNRFFGIPWPLIMGKGIPVREIRQEIILALQRDPRVDRVETVTVAENKVTRVADIRVTVVLTTGDIIEVAPARGGTMAEYLGSVDLRGKRGDGNYDFVTIQNGGQINVMSWGQTALGLVVPIRTDDKGRSFVRASEPDVHKPWSGAVTTGGKASVWQPEAGKRFAVLVAHIVVDIAGAWELVEYTAGGLTKVRTLLPLYLEGGHPIEWRPGGLSAASVDNCVCVVNNSGHNGNAYVALSGYEE